ncbi:phage baseplate assembly protein V [Metapseudomonas otitidis]|uniref:phage baseplate assembly protein V n=1 Tax=Metapseudomonas otitidis TaxID=319939 RepID=UPI00244969E6|nr:phage baseplate assembly protein V [Pseudomonas otitidis]MDH0337590.1 phage baseplate assembly protein V [Pseudomonas otitidis]
MSFSNRTLVALRRRLALMVTRGVVALVNDAAKMQALQITIMDGETLDDVEHWQPYGFTANPLGGAEALVLSVGGHRAHSVVVSCGDRRYRLTGMAGGEVAIYTDEQDKVHLKRGRVIEIETHTLNIKAAQGVNIDTPILTATGQIVSQGDQIAQGISQVGHVHGAVMPGPGMTGTPV